MRELTRCPVCHGSRLARSFTHRVDASNVFAVDRCIECTHQFTNPQPDPEELQPFYGEDYESWDPSRLSDEMVGAEVEAARRTGLLRHVPVGPGVDVLDVGCGAGLFLEAATRLGAKATGLDVGKPNTERLRARGLDVFCGTLAEYVAHRDARRFDVVTASHVFEHLHDPAEALRLAAGLLKPTGLVWLAVPNAANWGYRLLRGKWYAAQLPLHLHHFTPKSLRTLIGRAGLEGTVRSESIPSATASTLRDALRARALTPHALSKKIPGLDGFAAWLGRRLDRREAGDALLAEIRPVATARAPTSPRRVAT
jgi:2-polyprenyl-3-methyl-5-hydroxy-6-metoxy-1,4-benzoquinol methylase